jgi:SAM-dependent methyltransferase
VGESLSRWLALREAADFAARSERLTGLIAERLTRVGPDGRPLPAVHILDLGTGTGSNIRYLAPRIPVEQQWLAVDKDPRLLAEVAARSASIAPGVQVSTRSQNLGDLHQPDLFDGRHLVTASALLDLVSDSWLEWVAAECRRVGASALFTITYNGWNECDPRDADDARVFALFNQHQRTDKGLGGPAAGPRGTDVTRDCFARAGFEVHVAPSNWHIAPDAADFQRELIAGWASAAADVAPDERDAIEAWKRRRLELVSAGRSVIVVGHYDLAALPLVNAES